MPEKLYKEEYNKGDIYRTQYLRGIELLTEERIKAAEKQRKINMSPESFKNKQDALRTEFVNMLGWPLSEYKPGNAPDAEIIFEAEDDISYIKRILLTMPYNVKFYGMLFIPKTNGNKFPAVISQHGGLGTPESCSYINSDGNNYNDMTRRILRRGAVVFAPQLLIWNREDGNTDFDRQNIDITLKQTGSSIAALEIYYLCRTVDYLSSLPEVDPEKIGMIGLSYGGFYTLYTAACEKRIKSAYSSCFCNDRIKYNWEDFTWYNSANTFLDGQVGGLCAPRFLYAEAGSKDDLFAPEGAEKAFKEIAEFYKILDAGDNFIGNIFDGTHELDKCDDGINFIMRGLGCL